MNRRSGPFRVSLPRSQNWIRTENWKDLCWAPGAKEPITPPPLQSTQGLGFPKLTLLKTLKTSARKPRLALSVMATVLATAMSLWKKPGPVKESRPTFPIWPAPGRCQGPVTGPATDLPPLLASTPQRFLLPGAQSFPGRATPPVVAKYCSRVPETWTGPTRFGRQGSPGSVSAAQKPWVYDARPYTPLSRRSRWRVELVDQRRRTSVLKSVAYVVQPRSDV